MDHNEGVKSTVSTTAPAHRIPLDAALTLTLINLIWSGSSVMGKTALAALGPSTVAVLRFAPAAFLLVLLARIRGDSLRIRREDRGRIFFIGATGTALTYGIYYVGLANTTATEATLLLASEPILIAVIARFLLGERLRPIQEIGLGIGFSGVYLIIAQGLAFRLSAGVVANLLVLVALVCESTSGVVSKRLTGEYSWATVLVWQLTIGSSLLLPRAAWEWTHGSKGPIPVSVWGGVAYLCLLSTSFCYAAWFRQLSRHPISTMAAFLFIQPMMGPVLGYLFRGEIMGPWTVAGAVLVVLGVGLVTVVGSQPPKSEPV